MVIHITPMKDLVWGDLDLAHKCESPDTLKCIASGPVVCQPQSQCVSSLSRAHGEAAFPRPPEGQGAWDGVLA